MNINKVLKEFDKLAKTLFGDWVPQDNGKMRRVIDENKYELAKDFLTKALQKDRKEVIEMVEEEFAKSEMLPNISGHIGVDQAKQWIYDILDNLLKQLK